MPAIKLQLSKALTIKALEHQIRIMSRGVDDEINPGIKQLKEKDILEIRTAIASIEELAK